MLLLLKPRLGADEPVVEGGREEKTSTAGSGTQLGSRASAKAGGEGGGFVPYPSAPYA